MSANMEETKGRTVGGTELSWCRAVPGGTGIAVLALLSARAPDISRLQNALTKLQNSHPILKSKLHSNTATNTLSFVTSSSSSSFVEIESHNLTATSKLIGNPSLSPLQQILEHELNQNAWQNTTGRSPNSGSDLFFAGVYELPDSRWVLVLRLHVSACDRTTAVSLLRELLALVEEREGGEEAVKKEVSNKEEVCLAIEDLVPCGMAKKAMWARGVDVLSYSVNSLRLTNLKFVDTKSPRCSQVVRLRLNPNDTERLLSGCRKSGIKLCGALVAAGLIAGHGSKRSSKKYGVATLTDCRSSLERSLSPHDFGFYHSAVLNSHVVRGGESLWELGKKTYGAFADSKKCNKHFTDMADLNFLMCRAIENPGLTSSSSLRTAVMAVFEDTVIDDSGEAQREAGIEDYMGCASGHGVGPSIAIFDTIRDGSLDCVCVYPAPLHSREQMQEFVDKMKALLIEAGKKY